MVGNIFLRTQLSRASGVVFRRHLDFYYDRMYFPRSNLSASQVSNFLLSRFEALIRIKRPLSYPIGLQLEPTIRCQLSCPFCPRQRIIKSLEATDNGAGFMEWEKYVRLMSELGPHLLAVALWQWGEPLLHPRLADMIGLAHEYGIFTIVSTNGQVDPGSFDVKSLVRSGLDMIIVSMDGYSQNVYEAFRSGGSAENVRRFVRTMVKAKKDLKSSGPLVNVRTIAARESEKEIGKVRDFARDAGADVFTIKSISLYYDPDPENADLPKNTNYRSFQYQSKEKAEEYRRIPNLCLKPWSWPTLRYDGTLLACECDHDMNHIMGNVFTAGSFKNVWRSAKAQEIRRHFPSSGRTDLDFCLRCRYKLDDAIREVDYGMVLR